MEKVNRKHIPFQIGIGIIFLWCAVILLLGQISHLGVIGWLCFLFVPVCVAVVYFGGIAYKPLRNDPTAIGLSLYISWGFLALAIIINGSYIIVGNKLMGGFTVAADLILLAIYLGLILFSSIYQQNLSDRMIIERGNLEFSSELSRSVGGMLAGSPDPDIHGALASLKEIIDDSTNSVRSTQIDATIRSETELLKQMIDEQAEKEDILKEISKVADLCKKRNASM